MDVVSDISSLMPARTALVSRFRFLCSLRASILSASRWRWLKAILLPKYTSPGVADSGSVPRDRGEHVVPTRVIRLVVKLDEIGGEPLDPRHAYDWKGHLWPDVESVGCVLCVENEHPSTLARTGDDGDEHFWCRQHGPLVEIPYSMSKRYEVAIGDVAREGKETVRDSMLFPADLSESERTALIEQLLDEADEAEHEAGVE